jgi:purine-cytosine permease-like protein
MWEEDVTPLFIWAAVTASVVAATLGMLRRSRLRSALIWIWVSVPVGWVLMVEFMIDSTQVEGVLEHLILTLVPWAGIVVLSYNLVRRLREIHLGVD